MTRREKIEAWRIALNGIQTVREQATSLPERPPNLAKYAPIDQERMLKEIADAYKELTDEQQAKAVGIYNEASLELKSLRREKESKLRPMLTAYDKDKRLESYLVSERARQLGKEFSGNMEEVFNEYQRLGLLQLTDGQTDLLESSDRSWPKDDTHRESYMQLIRLKNEHLNRLGIPELAKEEQDITGIIDEARQHSKVIEAGGLTAKDFPSWTNTLRKAGMAD